MNEKKSLMNQIPIVVVHYTPENHDVEVVSNVPVRVIRIGDPSCPVSAWEMKETTDPERVRQLLGEAINDMHGDKERLTPMLADALKFMYEQWWNS
jgi:hypothetical protein